MGDSVNFEIREKQDGAYEITSIAPASPPNVSGGQGVPGKIGKPAASAEVQPAGRTAFELKSKIAPQFAFQFAPLLMGKA